MAKGATIYKADLQIADMDRNYYRDHTLTLACHPSETEERLMVRLLAFVLYAGSDLLFGGGVATPDEPDLWEKDLTGAVKLWMEIGHPEERSLRRASGRADRVIVVCYAGRGSHTWWSENRQNLERLDNLTVIHFPPAATQSLSHMADRTMKLQCNIQDGVVSVIKGHEMVEIEPEYLFGSR